MLSPKLSICIPTYNRVSYLATLLDHLEEVVAELPYAVEVVISDNASSDTTLELLQAACDRLPLVVLRQTENLGAVRNVSAAMRAAKGTYLVYLGDDDRLKPAALVDSITQLDANPQAAGLYAPWEVLDLVSNTVTSHGYKQSQDVTIPQGNYARLMEHVAEHAIFSEICILRGEAFRALQPMINDLAFWAFTMPCEYLGYGDLIYASKPFYSSISRHFPGDKRSQQGIRDVMSAWDIYRGGVDYMYGLALQHGGLTQQKQVAAFVSYLPVERMAKALELRLATGAGDPLENYALAARLRGRGVVKHLPVPMEHLRNSAVIYFVCVKLPDTLKAEGVAIIGDCPETAVQQLNDIANLPVRHVSRAEDICENDLVFDIGCKDDALVKQASTLALGHMLEADLLKKFP